MAYNAYSNYDPAVQGYLTQAEGSGAWSGRPFVSVEQSSLQQASDWGRHQQKKDIEWANQQRMSDPAYWMQAFGMSGGGGGGTGGDYGYKDTSGEYRTRLNALLDNPDAIANTGVYKFALQQGNEAVNRNMAAKGLLKSGNRLAELTKFGQGLASQQYGAEADRLSNILNQTRQADVGRYSADTGRYSADVQGQNQLKALLMKNALDNMQKPTQYGFGGGGGGRSSGGSAGGGTWNDTSNLANPGGMWTMVDNTYNPETKQAMYENSLTGRQELRY